LHVIERSIPRLTLVALALVAAPALAQQKRPPLPKEPGAPTQSPPAFDSTALQALQWRNVGPFRGGRATAVAGVPSNPLLYYMGATGGGVWKTEDGGNSWRNITDGFLNVGSIGAIAVADDDPNVIYVGTGEAPVRGQSSSFGDGMYKSTDAGRSWTHIGLEGTRQISKVIVHPRNDDLVYVAAQGSRWAPTDERGVYRSGDGGKTWKRVLFVDRSAGPSDMVMDPNNSRVIYAAFWDHQRTPWQVRSGGPHSGIWKTTDGGDSWTRLTEGLPKLMGKIGVSVSAANSDRVYAIIEADSGGLFRSDDAGKTWRRTSGDRLLRARAWYYTVVTADPKSPDVVYVINAPIVKSTDGGRTFAPISSPHGDNHALWINPSNSLNMVNANDGGANVTFNGGKTWSTQMNQPTAQFYRVEVDDRFPYRLYGGQQDNTTVVIANRNFGPGIDRDDWAIHAGCESASFAFDPKDPRYTYATCYQGIIEEYDTVTGARRNIQAWPALGLAEPSDLQKYRFNWQAPLTSSPHDRRVMYHGGNVLFRSDDRGTTWTAISPDLTRNDKAHQGLGGAPFTNEGAGGEVYNTIFYVVESPHEAGTIWVGTDDGLVQLTRDGGKTWSNVTPRGLAEGQVNAIEVSPHDAATAYVAFTRYKWNDDTPHLFRTTDYGKTWTDLAGGLPQDYPARVVREDPKRKGLLYAGTETGAWVSFDAGARWQPLGRGMPKVPVTDLKVHDDDLAASTEGRAFWVLDDLTTLEQMSEQVAKAPLHLYKPRRAYRIDGITLPTQVPDLGTNPPSGAVLRYSLGAKPDSAQALTLDIVDAAGAVVRHYTSQAPAPGGPGVPPTPALPVKAGLDQFVWDLRGETPSRVSGIFLAGQPSGYRVAAGTYTARMTLGATTVSQPIEVVDDPRIRVDPADERKQVALAKALASRVDEIHKSVVELRSVRDQANALIARVKDTPDAASVAAAAKAIVAKVDTIEGRLVEPKHKTFQDVINFRNGLSDQFIYLQDAVDGSAGPMTQGATARSAELEQQWAEWRARIDALLTKDVPALNTLAAQKGIPAIVIPPRAKVAM
jgi:photosystem II stability/assembly factor-like uncharacterized protein